jgi:DNA-directed RNA polymerase specialized sigma54-like protein
VLNNKQQTNINNSDKRQNLSSYEHNQINSNNLPAQNITAILEGDINEAGFMDDDFDDFEISGLCQNSSSLGTSQNNTMLLLAVQMGV